MKKTKVFFRIISYTITVILLALLAVNSCIIVKRNILKKDDPTVFGYTMSVIISGSMSPAIKVNDAIITKAVDDYKIGDIIMFRDGDSFVAHRIVAKHGGEYVTRGDANNVEDEPYVKPADIVGKAVMIIPRVGVIAGFLQSPFGMLCMLAAFVVLIELPDLINRRKQG